MSNSATLRISLTYAQKMMEAQVRAIHRSLGSVDPVWEPYRTSDAGTHLEIYYVDQYGNEKVEQVDYDQIPI